MDAAAASTVAFNWVDGAVLGVVLVCILFGYLTGLVMQLAGLVAVGIGVGASLLLGPTVADALGRWLESRQVAGLVAYIGCFSVAAGSVRILAAVFGAILKKLKLEVFDRLAGAGVGAVKGVFIAAVVLVIGGTAGVESVRAPIRESLLGHSVVAVADRIAAWADEKDVGRNARRAGEEILDAARSGRERLDDALDDDAESADADADAAPDAPSGDAP